MYKGAGAFVRAEDMISRETSIKSVGRIAITDLDFADDIVLFAENEKMVLQM